MPAPHLWQYDAVATFWAPHFEQKTEFSAIPSDYNSHQALLQTHTTDDTDGPDHVERRTYFFRLRFISLITVHHCHQW
jgi:hypothetical protein